MLVHNCRNTTDTLKIFKIYLPAFILWFVWHACFLAEVSAQEAVAADKEAHSSGEETASDHILTRRKDGFYLYTDEGAGFQMRLGGGLQVDYRYYTEEDREDNRFDIRRARLNLSGRLFHLLGYRVSYEFEGNEPQNLLDAYGEIGIYGPNVLRFGQFKVPFSLEWQTSYKNIFFAERSMGWFLDPRRDIGLGLHGDFFQDAVNYAVGVFNGDGTDGSSGGSDNDDPEWAGRFVIAPFKKMSSPWLNSFQIGGSATYENIDVSNVDLHVKSTGMVDTNLSLYVLNSNTKFGVLHDAGEMLRTGLEAAWTFGSLSMQGEYIHLKYTDLKGSSGSARNADFSSWYASAVFWLTGERPEFIHGVPRSITPKKNFSLDRGNWGALGIGCRINHFSGDKDWIKEDAFVSVRKADAFSGALNWVLNPAFALILDYTYTDLSDPIRVQVNPDGSVDYIDKEHVVTLRSQLVF